MARQAVLGMAIEVHKLFSTKRDLARAVQAGPCTLAELGVLRAVEEHGPCVLGRLAGESGVDASVVSRHVSSLVASGFVERTVDPLDGRSHPVRLTAEGRAALCRCRSALIEQWEDALSPWSDTELDDLAATLSRLRQDLFDGPRPATGVPARTARTVAGTRTLFSARSTTPA